MKIYEVTSALGRKWFDNKAAAMRDSARRMAEIKTWDIDKTRAGIVKLLNEVACYTAEPEKPATRTVIRKTANKPPEPDPAYPENR